MRLDELSEFELSMFLRGRDAARRGEPFNAHADENWIAGYRFGEAEKREKNACH